MTARSQTQAFAVRKRLREELHETLLPAFERAFDELASEGEVLHLAKLDLLVQVRDGDDLMNTLPDLLYRSIHERLGPLVRGEAHAATPAMTLRRSLVGPSRLERLIRYLTTGALPWPVAGSPAGTIGEQLQPTFPRDLADIVGAAHQLARGRDAFYFRLLDLVPEGDWIWLARTATANLSHEQADALLAEVAALASGRGSTTRYQRLQHAAAILTSMTPTDGRAPLEPTAPLRTAESRQAPALGVAAPSTADAAPFVPAPGDEPHALAAGHLGLLLLHPFLPRLFEQVGIDLRDPLQLPALAPPRAAALLHFLATGEDDPHEWDLGFVKVLLGLRPDSPVPISAGLVTDADRQEVDALLRSVIDHWSVLKNTSVDGLRVSFLQRRGLVREEEQGWRVQVEPASFDVLLGRLPWGIAAVKLPWMKKPIFTEWPTP